MSDPENPDRPWTEEQWLAEFRRSDVRSAKFGELLETLADHPDRDAIIAREMGWDDDEEESDSLEEPSFEAGDEFDDVEEDDEAASSEPHDPTDLLHDDDDDDRAEGLPLLSDVPAYQVAIELAHYVIDLNNRLGDLEFDCVHHDELFSEAMGNVLIPSAKLRGGHSHGYDDEICANIVCNRFALEAAEKAQAALVELDPAGVLPAEYRTEVLPRLSELIKLLNERIAEMRKRVWW